MESEIGEKETGVEFNSCPAVGRCDERRSEKHYQIGRAQKIDGGVEHAQESTNLSAVEAKVDERTVLDSTEAVRSFGERRGAPGRRFVQAGRFEKAQLHGKQELFDR